MKTAALKRPELKPLPKPAPRKPYQGKPGGDRVRRDFRYQGA